jgi:hypothetical protein
VDERPTFNWPWIADLATKCDLRAHRGDPMRIENLKKGLPKSDRKDAIAAGSLWLRKMYPEAYLAPPDVRRRRGTFRVRGLFVRMGAALKNSIHGQLCFRGISLDKRSHACGIIGRRNGCVRETHDFWGLN